MTKPEPDQKTQKIVDDFDAHAKKRARELLSCTENVPLQATREIAFCLGYKAGVIDSSASLREDKAVIQNDEASIDPAQSAPEIIPLSAHATGTKLRISVSPARSVRPISVRLKESDGTAWRVIAMTVDSAVCAYDNPPYPVCRGNCWIDLEVECPHDQPPTEAKPAALHGVVLCEASALPVAAGDTERDRQWADFRKSYGAQKLSNGEWKTTFRGDSSSRIATSHKTGALDEKGRTRMKVQSNWAVSARYASPGARPGNRRHPCPEDFCGRTVVGPAEPATVEAVLDLLDVPEDVRARVRARDVVRNFVEDRLVPDAAYPHHATGMHYVSAEPDAQLVEWTIAFTFITRMVHQEPGGSP